MKGIVASFLFYSYLYPFGGDKMMSFIGRREKKIAGDQRNGVGLVFLIVSLL